MGIVPPIYVKNYVPAYNLQLEIGNANECEPAEVRNVQIILWLMFIFIFALCKFNFSSSSDVFTWIKSEVSIISRQKKKCLPSDENCTNLKQANIMVCVTVWLT